MAPPTKTPDGRRKSGGQPSLVVTLNVPSTILRDAIADHVGKPESPAPPSVAPSEQKDMSDVKESPSTPAPAANGNGDHASDSNAATPGGEGTPAPSVMGPPTDGRKKGVKRAAALTADGQPKVRGKPGPKKKPRL